MGKIAFVFSGQGAQYSGMGLKLYEGSASAKRVFEAADKIRPNTSSQCFNGTKEELQLTVNTQPCLYCVDLAAARALEEAGVTCDMAAGFSLGELAALAFSGIVSDEDGSRLVIRRGELMNKAAEGVSSAMLAVLALKNEAVEELCSKFKRVYPVNYNCPGQLVVAGAVEEIADFKLEVKAAGGKALPLAVSGGFHSPFMSGAAKGFYEYLSDFDFSAPKLPLYSNYTSGVYEGDYKALLSRQIENPVRWQKIIENMISAGADTFIEVGAGKTLSGLISKISNAVRIFNVEDMDSLQSAVKADLN